jgi:hypothetical protein
MLRHGLRRAEKAAQGQVESFRTRDGRRYIYDPQEVGIELFLFACETLRAPYTVDPPPEEPQILEAIRNAENPHEVISRFCPANGSFDRAFVNLPAMVYGE